MYVLIANTHPYLYIHVADLTLTEQVRAAAGQGRVNSTSTSLDDLQDELSKPTSPQHHSPLWLHLSCLSAISVSRGISNYSPLTT